LIEWPLPVLPESPAGLVKVGFGARADITAAKAMLANPDLGVTEIAHRLGVSPATLYRYIPAARTANTPSV
jgi:predicted transcriptional regulator